MIEDLDRRNASKEIYYRDPNYQVATTEIEENLEVAVVEIVNKKPYACKAFIKVEPTKA